ncbi:MAG: gluconate 2-dehydrogenase subunit 3 family protein [Pseudomonadales bacterium]|nr:gluconate 2-dehydrogenase subunit 3 family protein [Pseudomonadales bacterium]
MSKLYPNEALTEAPEKESNSELNRALSRRQFMAGSASLARGSLLVLSMPAILTACREAEEARSSGAAFQTLSEQEAAELAAVAARIIPTDETPGATEAGVIYFMDNVLGDERRVELLASLRDGLREMQYQVATDYSESYFHLLDVARQDELLAKIETTPFFNTVRYLTIAGTFSMPQYGGNRDGIGMQLIGMESRPAWAPPFGAYDADYMERGE